MQRLELKGTVTADDSGAITGLAWPFGTADRVGDVIVKGAFAGSPASLPMLAFHDPNDPVGVWDEVRETDKGLEVKGRLLVEDVARAREIHALVRSGAIGGLSIGFVTKKSAPRKGGRTISALDVLEVSLVTIPSHPGARVTSAKSAADALRLAEIINTASQAIRAKEAHS